jgi:RHS repeat-associated protein
MMALSAHEGTILEYAGYDPFGNVAYYSSAPQKPVDNPYLKYTGREYDPNTGLYYYRARYYDPTIGRFISEDPLGFGAGINFYAYAGNNPVNFNDPMGLVRWGDAFSSGLGMLSSGAGVVVGSAGILGGGALAAMPEPATTVAGIGTIALSSTVLANSSGNFILNTQNFWSAINDEVPTLPSSLAEGMAGIIAPGDPSAQLMAQGFNLTIDLASGRMPVGLIPNNMDSALGGWRMANFSEVSNYSSAVRAVDGFPITVGSYGDSFVTRSVDTLQGAATLQTYLNSYDQVSTNIFGSSAAGGGFVLYPNRPNTNMMQSVYSK